MITNTPACNNVGNCPKCGQHFDDDFSPYSDNVPPQPKDYAICIRCYAILRFDKNMERKELTPQDEDEIPAEVYQLVELLKLSKQQSKKCY